MASSRNARQDGCFADLKIVKKMLSRRIAQHQPDQVCDYFAKMLPPMGGLSATLTSRLHSFGGKLCIRSRCGLSTSSKSRQTVVSSSTAEETSLRYE